MIGVYLISVTDEDNIVHLINLAHVVHLSSHPNSDDRWIITLVNHPVIVVRQEELEKVIAESIETRK